MTFVRYGFVNRSAILWPTADLEILAPAQRGSKSSRAENQQRERDGFPDKCISTNRREYPLLVLAGMRDVFFPWREGPTVRTTNKKGEQGRARRKRGRRHGYVDARIG